MSKSLKDKVFAYIDEKYLVKPEYPWERDNTSAVFRHKDNRKWFALVMNVSGSKTGLESDEVIPVLNLKIDDPVFHDPRPNPEAALYELYVPAGLLGRHKHFPVYRQYPFPAGIVGSR